MVLRRPVDSCSVLNNRIRGTQKTTTGTVEWFSDARGFGFIAPDDSGNDLSAHFSEIRSEGFKTLAENQKVSFDVTQGTKGLQASNIQPQ
jgi:CspA family cold shock protein